MSLIARAGRRALEIIGVIGLLLIMCHTVANVLMRKFANHPLNGVNEYVGHWYLPLVAFVGIYLAEVASSHIDADWLYSKLNARERRLTDVVVGLLVGAVCAGVAYYGSLAALDAYEVRQTAGVTGVEVWPVYFLAPVAFAAFGVQALVNAFRARPGAEDESTESKELIEAAVS